MLKGKIWVLVSMEKSYLDGVKAQCFGCVSFKNLGCRDLEPFIASKNSKWMKFDSKNCKKIYSYPSSSIGQNSSTPTHPSA